MGNWAESRGWAFIRRCLNGYLADKSDQYLFDKSEHVRAIIGFCRSEEASLERIKNG